MAIKKTLQILLTAALASAAVAQAPRVSGTVKAATADSITVAPATGDAVSVAVGAETKLMQVAPGSTNLASATPIAAADIAVGDRVIVTGTAGDTAAALHAARVIVMKSGAIAQSHAAEEAAWRQGGGGLVKSVDAGAGTIVLMSGAKTVTVHVSGKTNFKRYSGDSVKFEDAVASSLAEVKPGDQLRVRGTKSADGSSVDADAIVTGAFANYSGLLTAVDGTAGTVTLKDLASKKVVVVKVTAGSDVHRVPAMMAQRLAAVAKGGAAAGAPAAGGPPAGGAEGRGGARGAGADLSSMLARLPTETLGGLKTGDAVMIVATQPASGDATAVTLLAGVEPILEASPKGETVLSPWSVGGAAPEGGVQ